MKVDTQELLHFLNMFFSRLSFSSERQFSIRKIGCSLVGFKMHTVVVQIFRPLLTLASDQANVVVRPWNAGNYLKNR